MYLGATRYTCMPTTYSKHSYVRRSDHAALSPVSPGGTVRTSSELLHIVSRPPFSFPASRPGPSARNKPTFLNLPIEVDSSGILRRKNLFLFFLFVCLANIVLFQTPTTHYKGRQVSLAKEASGRPLESHRALQDDG